MAVKMHIEILIFWFCLSLNSCTAQKASDNCGVVVLKTKFFDTITHQYVSKYFPDLEMWYKDSLVIEKAMSLAITADTNGRQTGRFNLLHYTFIDLRTRSYYDYATFSDTAQIMKKYTQPDSVSVFSGWSFWARHDLPRTEPPQSLPDTTIDGITYKRVKFINKNYKTTPEYIGYLRCDKKGTMFQFDKAFSEKMGCPLVRLDYLPTPQNPVAPGGEIEFVSDTLTPEELKVFVAWERNAKLNPVK